MSDTSKCPVCGGDLFWCENGNPRHGYCQSPDCYYETATTSAKIDAEVMLHAALHRVRELEMSEQILRGGAEHLRRQVQELELTVKVLESDKQTRNDALDHERKRIAAKDAALRVLESLGERLTDFDPPGPVTDEQRREDQYGRKIQNIAREALEK